MSSCTSLKVFYKLITISNNLHRYYESIQMLPIIPLQFLCPLANQWYTVIWGLSPSVWCQPWLFQQIYLFNKYPRTSCPHIDCLYSIVPTFSALCLGLKNRQHPMTWRVWQIQICFIDTFSAHHSFHGHPLGKGLNLQVYPCVGKLLSAYLEHGRVQASNLLTHLGIERS